MASKKASGALEKIHDDDVDVDVEEEDSTVIEEVDVAEENELEKEEVHDIDVALVIPAEPPTEWVTLEMKLLNWDYMNYTKRVKTTTQVFAIKRELETRHGRIKDLRVCKGQFSERNELKDDMRTLKECGIKGRPDGEAIATCQIFYDFKPCDHDDPLLLVS